MKTQSCVTACQAKCIRRARKLQSCINAENIIIGIYMIMLRVLVLVALCVAQTDASTRVAIIGAGVGGAFAATRLLEKIPSESQLELNLFEASEQEGGRVQEFRYNGTDLELGASILWDYNTYIKTAALQLGLKLRAPGRVDVSEEGADRQPAGSGRKQRQRGACGFAIWNGSALVLNMTGSWYDTIRAALRYGTAALRYRSLVASTFRRFQTVYDMQAAGRAWETPEQMLRAMGGLFNETQQRSSEYLRAWLQQPAWWLWGGAAFSEELAGAVNRCNYNQDNEQLNALAGLVSYGPAAYGDVWQIEGGNRQLVSGLLAASGARVIRSARVIAVSRHPKEGTYELEVAVRRSGREGVRAGGEEQQTRRNALDADVEGNQSLQRDTEEESREVFGPYQAVVIATPLLGSGIRLHLGESGEGDRSTTASTTASTPTSATSATSSDTIAAARPVNQTSDAAASANSSPNTSTFTLENMLSFPMETAMSSTRTLRTLHHDTAAAAAMQRPYQVTVTTYVAATGLRASYFNVVQLPCVAAIYVSSSAQTPLSAVSELMAAKGRGKDGREDGGGERVFKVFSRQELSRELLEQLFDSPRVLASRRWYAYPRFQPPERFVPFVLAPGLVYNNALEPAASAMEMAALAATNSALLVARHLASMGLVEKSGGGGATAESSSHESM